MLSKELQVTFKLAYTTAMKYGHDVILLEHILFALINDPDTRDILEECGANINVLKKDLIDFFKDDVEKTNAEESMEPEETLAVQRIIQIAANHVLNSDKNIIEGVNILIAMYTEQDSHAVFFLESEGVTRFDIISFVSHGIIPTDDDDFDDFEEFETFFDEFEEDEESEKKVTDALAKFTVNLTEKALEGKIDPIIGRKVELKRMIQTLCRRRKNNPLLVGEPGVGKTALAEGLALKITQKKVPSMLIDYSIFALDMGSLLAGTKFRGEFEDRLKAVVNALKENEKSILFIDEIHTIIGAGATSGGSMDASNLLKPALNNGEIKCIGSTTYQEFKTHILKDRALARRFHKIDVKEPSQKEAVAILKGIKEYYEEHHHVLYPPSALEAAVDLSVKYINDRYLPDKAIDLIDEAGAAHSLLPDSRKKKMITTRDIQNIVAETAQIPPAQISRSDKDKLSSLADDLNAVVFGQNQAIQKLTHAVKLSRAGLKNLDKPIGSFLFTGPTGVGKTELSKQLANILDINFIRFDMSEYSEKHTVSRLIGAPPGYVGFEQGGLLTDAVNKTPHTVILLDEIEKAHSEIFNILLQVMDHGTLTDNNGREANFKNAVIIMTSNIGAKEIAGNVISFNEENTNSDAGSKAVEKFFTPEFRNRLDAIINFGSLTLPLMEKVVDKFIGELQTQLADKKIIFKLMPAARKWLAKKGFDPKFGARPIYRLIQAEIQEKLVDSILFGDLKKGGLVIVKVKKDKLDLIIERI